MIFLLLLTVSLSLCTPINGADNYTKEETIQGLLAGNKIIALATLSTFQAPASYLGDTLVETQFPDSRITEIQNNNKRYLMDELLEFLADAKRTRNNNDLENRAPIIKLIRPHIEKKWDNNISFHPTQAAIALCAPYNLTSGIKSGSLLVLELLKKHDIDSAKQLIDNLPICLFNTTKKGCYTPTCLFPITYNNDAIINGLRCTAFTTTSEAMLNPTIIFYWPHTNVSPYSRSLIDSWGKHSKKFDLDKASLDTENYNYILELYKKNGTVTIHKQKKPVGIDIKG